MACELIAPCDVVYEFLKHGLPVDTIDVDPVHMLKGMHAHNKDYKEQITQYFPCGTEVQPCPSLRRQMK